jgi:hypothetical protein
VQKLFVDSLYNAGSSSCGSGSGSDSNIDELVASGDVVMDQLLGWCEDDFDEASDGDDEASMQQVTACTKNSASTDQTALAHTEYVSVNSISCMSQKFYSFCV